MKRTKFVFRLLIAVFVVSASVTLFSCYPYGSTNPNDYDVYLTLHKEDLTSYKNYRTYIMRDSVYKLGDGSITSAYDNTILSKVASNLSSLGYTRITNPADTASADLIINNAITNSTTYYVDYNYGYYWGYYYPWTTVYSVTTGSVITTMIDKKNALSGTSTYPAVWMGIVNGAAGDASTAATRISDGINKVFAQSPYLKVN